MAQKTKRTLPRIPGCRYGPRLEPELQGHAVVGYRVVQSGYWGDSRIMGPVRKTKDDAVAAWRRMARTVEKRYGARADAQRQRRSALKAPAESTC